MLLRKGTSWCRVGRRQGSITRRGVHRVLREGVSSWRARWRPGPFRRWWVGRGFGVRNRVRGEACLWCGIVVWVVFQQWFVVLFFCHRLLYSCQLVDSGHWCWLQRVHWNGSDGKSGGIGGSGSSTLLMIAAANKNAYAQCQADATSSTHNSTYNSTHNTAHCSPNSASNVISKVD